MSGHSYVLEVMFLEIVKIFKKPNSKLIVFKLSLDEDCLITKASLEGDFFAYRPEVVDESMDSLKGLKPDELLAEELCKKLMQSYIIGVEESDLLTFLKEVFEEGRMKCVKSLK